MARGRGARWGVRWAWRRGVVTGRGAQEDMKKLGEDDEDAYMGAKWADPKQLKGHLQGTAALRWR